VVTTLLRDMVLLMAAFIYAAALFILPSDGSLLAAA
jgi:hypothetical protein